MQPIPAHRTIGPLLAPRSPSGRPRFRPSLEAGATLGAPARTCQQLSVIRDDLRTGDRSPRTCGGRSPLDAMARLGEPDWPRIARGGGSWRSRPVGRPPARPGVTVDQETAAAGPGRRPRASRIGSARQPQRSPGRPPRRGSGNPSAPAVGTIVGTPGPRLSRKARADGDLRRTEHRTINPAAFR